MKKVRKIPIKSSPTSLAVQRRICAPRADGNEGLSIADLLQCNQMRRLTNRASAAGESVDPPATQHLHYLRSTVQPHNFTSRERPAAAGAG
jgi:hypothetical protein